MRSRCSELIQTVVTYFILGTLAVLFLGYCSILACTASTLVLG